MASASYRKDRRRDHRGDRRCTAQFPAPLRPETKAGLTFASSAAFLSTTKAQAGLEGSTNASEAMSVPDLERMPLVIFANADFQEAAR